MLYVYGLLLISFLIFLLLGPRVKIDTTLKPLSLPEDLDTYLAGSEGAIEDLGEDVEKKIIWAGEKGQKTPLSIVYLHGFSATRKETEPLCDQVAAELGANLFYTRFTGHGCTKEAMRDCSVNSWLNDASEAMEIAGRIGEQVVIIGLSTGATIATWLATHPLSQRVKAFIFLSPNYRLADKRSFLLTFPWGKQITDLVIGPEYSWEPTNTLHAKYWTCRFPSQALLPMAGLIQMVKTLPLERVTTPLLVIYSPDDEVVNPAATRETFTRFGSAQKEIISYNGSSAEKNHVIAGDILSPDSTGEVAGMITSFIRKIS